MSSAFPSSFGFMSFSAMLWTLITNNSFCLLCWDMSHMTTLDWPKSLLVWRRQGTICLNKELSDFQCIIIYYNLHSMICLLSWLYNNQSSFFIHCLQSEICLFIWGMRRLPGTRPLKFHLCATSLTLAMKNRESQNIIKNIQRLKERSSIAWVGPHSMS